MLKLHSRIYLIALVMAIVLMTLQGRSQSFRPFSFVHTTVNHFNNALVKFELGLLDVFRIVSGNEYELRSLRRQVKQLKVDNARTLELELENARLSNLLEFRSNTASVVTSARLVAHGVDRWSKAFVVDKGEVHGVRKDMTVITTGGLMGKVVDTTKSFSTVLPLVDTRFSVAVRIQGRRLNGVLVGSGMGQLSLKYVNADVEVPVGAKLITSGLDAMFPPGIDTGTITSVHTPQRALFKTIEVTPLVSVNSVEEVIIVTR